MYQSKRHRRPVRTDAHSGSRRDFLRRHEAAARAAAAGSEVERAAFFDTLFDIVTDTRMLFLAAEDLRRAGGPAPGVDGISPADLDKVDLVALVPKLRQRIRDRSYRPARERKVEKSKGPGRGKRTLSLAVFADRVVQRAILMSVQGFIDPQLMPTTFGGRPGFSTADAFIAAERAAAATGSWVWVVADVRKAFDEIPHGRLNGTIRRWFGDTRVADSITSLMTAGRTVGVPQGGALSMLLLNLFLHDHLDRPFAEAHPEWTLIRWVDDLIIITNIPEEANDAHAYVKDLLQKAGTKLKDTTKVVDLAGGESAEWLGVQIGRCGNELCFTISTGAWDDLREKLTQTHKEDRPTRHARDIIRGWIAAHGVVMPTREQVDELINALKECELEDTASFDEITTWWGRRINGTNGGGPGAATTDRGWHPSRTMGKQTSRRLRPSEHFWQIPCRTPRRMRPIRAHTS